MPSTTNCATLHKHSKLIGVRTAARRNCPGRRSPGSFNTLSMNSSVRLLSFSLSLLFVLSLVVVGCGDTAGERAQGDSVSGETEAPASTAYMASETGGAAKFKAGMIDLSKRMLEIAESINSVQTAEAAEPKLAAVMVGITALLDTLADDIDKMSQEDLNAIKTMRNDPELQEWTRKVNDRMAALEQQHPDASKKLQEIGRRQSEKMAVAMRELVEKIDQKMPGTTGPETGIGDSAAGSTNGNGSKLDGKN